MMMRSLSLRWTMLTAALLPGGDVTAEVQTPKTLSAEGQKAFKLLLTTDQFQHARIGDGGVLSEGVKAFRIVLAEPGADETFKRLIKDGRSPGQLYGLCGVYFTDHAYFLKAVERFRGVTEEVMVEDGCLRVKEPISEVVFRKGAMQLKGPDDSVEAWLRRNQDRPSFTDIFGGAVPMEFRGKAGK